MSCALKVVVLVMAVWCGCILTAADAPLADATQPVITAEEAHRQETLGKQLMRDMGSDASAAGTAAIALSKALRYYDHVQDVDHACDLEASIYWCTKRMKLDDLARFKASSAQSTPEDIAAVSRIEAVSARPADATSADSYLLRAKRFASEHADDPFAIAVRYFEVAQRFVETPAGLEAQALSLAAQGTAMQAQAKAADQDKVRRRTLFSQPETLPPGLLAMPTSADQRAATLQIHKLYKDDFAKSKPAVKRRLAGRLLMEASSAGDDAPLRWALISESAQLSCDIDDIAGIISAADARVASFSGVDGSATRKAWFGKMHGPLAIAAIKLLENPEDADANSAVGRAIALDARRWSDALPLLARGSDAAWKKAADMELAGPAGPAQLAELGDAWYALGLKAKNAARESLWTHALDWYHPSAQGRQGISAATISARIEEIERSLPIHISDWGSLTPQQWDRITGPITTVSVMQERTPANLTVTPGTKIRVVPHPTDLWSLEGLGIQATVDWKGFAAAGRQGNFQIGALVVYYGAASSAPGVVDGSGALAFGPYRPIYVTAKQGAIRVKVIACEDDE